MSSISSTSSSASTKPFRSIYAKDARGHDLSDAYARKYGSTAVSSSSVPTHAVSRLVYAKDARGVDISTATYQAEEYEVSKTTPIIGDDGLPRNSYDYGQRQRTLAYWSELSHGAKKVNSSSSTSLLSAKTQ